MERFRLEGAGKGDKARRVDKKQFDTNYILAFGKECDRCNGTGKNFREADIDETPDECFKCQGIGKVEK